MDVRPGGEWRFVMRGPDGRDYQNRIIYREIIPPELIRYSHVSGPLFESTATFTEQGAYTSVTVQMVFETAELRDRVAKEYGAVEGLQQTLARLDEEVAKMAAKGPEGQEFMLSREFAAPRELVFKAWTESQHLAEWWGPKGFKIRIAKLDFRPGGIFHYSMTTPKGEEWWGRFVYREIVPPERLVFVNSFSDAKAGLAPAPMIANFPLEVLSTITFTERSGKTTVTLQSVPLNATEEELATFASMRESMKAGWGGTMDQLDGFLATASR
jgi:uncharacterized protein YndB with AHSA1/START domain